MTHPRIVSLLASSTEIVASLGLLDHLVGISHECDYPGKVTQLPRVTKSRVDGSLSSSQIDEAVRSFELDGLSIYEVDVDALNELQPDVILTQDTCKVCAVSMDDVQNVVNEVVNKDVKILSLSPSSLEDVFANILEVGEALDCFEGANQVVDSLYMQLDFLRAETTIASPKKVLGLEWISPPMVIGHWTPELFRIAGGEPILSHTDMPTKREEWSTIVEFDPEVVVIMPCGFKIPQTMTEVSALMDIPGFAEMKAVRSQQVYVADGNAYFNRPGPRLVRSAQVAAAAIQPALYMDKFKIAQSELQKVTF